MNNTVNKTNKTFTKKKKNASQDFRFISEEDGGVISAMAVITVGLLFARCHLIFGAHPLGLAMIAALPTLVFPGLIGVIVGSLTLGEDGIILAVCAALTIIVRLFASRGNKNEKAFFEGPMLKMSSAVISGFSASVYEAIVNGLNMTTVFYSLSMILITPLLTFVFSGLFSKDVSIKTVIKSEGEILSLKSKTDSEKYNIIFFQCSALVTLFLIALSLSEISFFGIGSNLIFISIATLLVSKKFGAPRAMAVGFVSALGISGITSVSFALVGLVSALIFPFGAVSAVICGGATATIWSIYSSGMEGLLSFLPEYAISATIITPVLKNISTKKSEVSITESSAGAADMSGIFALSYRNRFSGSLDTLEVALNSISSVMRSFGKGQESPSEDECRDIIIDAATDSCRECGELEFCKKEDIAPAKKNLDKLTRKLLSGEKILPEDINTNLEFCSTPEKTANEINYRMSRLCEKKYKMSVLGTGAEQYDLIGKMISEARSKDRKEKSQDAKLSEKITKALVSMGYPSASAKVFGERKKHFIIAMEDEGGHEITRSDVMKTLEAESSTKIGAPEFFRKDKCAIMECDTRRSYSSEFAIASSSGSGEISGDTATVFELADDRLYALCSDGMGSGDEARHTSRFVADFLKCALGIGSAETALHLLNSTIRGRGAECSATVDLFSLDLLDGSATFIKSGAAPSFVKRDSSIFRIKSSTAPIGLMKGIDAEKIRVEVKGGDYVIMISDGVSAAAEETPWLLELLSKPPKESSRAYADYILSEARKNSKSHDDMSVIVLKILKT